MKALNMGSLNIDYVYQVDHMVKAGETLSSSGMEVFCGGKGLNQSIALAKAGVSVYHAGLIGEDGHALLETCKEHGVDTTYIQKVEGKGGHTIIQVDQSAQNCILLYGGSNQKFTQAYIDHVLKDFGLGDIILLQNEINFLSEIIEKAYEKGMTIVLNPSPYNAILEQCDFSKISIFLLNEIEGAQMCGKEDPHEIIETLLDAYPNAQFVLTMGQAGVCYADKTTRCSQDIFKVKAVDTTAAGDTFTGYFIAGLIEGLDIKTNLRRSAKASSITVSRKGAAVSIPRKDEVVGWNI